MAPMFLNGIGIDVFVLGNHEFDFGPGVLSSFIGNLSSTAISCNIDVSEEPLLAGKVQRFLVKTMPSGLKVGIIGFTPEDTAILSSPGPGVTFFAPSSVAAACIADAKEAGAEIILGATHVGYDVDLGLAEAFREFDVVIGGHSHSLLHTGTPPNILINPETAEQNKVSGPYPTVVENEGKSIPVATAFWGSRYLGVLDLIFQPMQGVVSASGAPILLGGANSTNNVQEDPEFAQMIIDLKDPLNEYVNLELGSAEVLLDGERFNVRNKETNLANLITDAMIWYAKTQTSILDSSNLPYIAHMNGGGIRASIAAGSINLGNVLTVLPFGNMMIIKRVSAAALRDALNHGFTGWTGTSESAGRFGQYSNLQVSFNPSEDIPVNERLAKTILFDRDGKDINLDSYNGDVLVIMNDFVGRGGDGYGTFGDSPLILDTSVALAQIVADYISNFSPVAPSVEGRIVNCVEDPENARCREESECSPISGDFRIENVGCSGYFLAYALNCSDTKARFGSDTQYREGRTIWRLDTTFIEPTAIKATFRNSCQKNVLASNNIPTFGSSSTQWQYNILPVESSCDTINLVAKGGQQQGKFLAAGSMCKGFAWRSKGTGQGSYWKLIQA